MTREEFDHVLKTVSSGTPFRALLQQHSGSEPTEIRGKIEVGEKAFWLCFNEGISGETSPNKHSYKNSWVIGANNFSNIKEFSTEPQIVNNYQIY